MPINYNSITTEYVNVGWLRHTVFLSCDDVVPNITGSIRVDDYGKPADMQANIDKDVKEFSEKCLAKIKIDTNSITDAMDKAITTVNITHNEAVTDIKAVTP